MPKRTLLFLSFVLLSGAGLAQTSLPVPTDLTAVLAPTMGPLPVIALSWNAPEGLWAYRVYRSDGDSLNFRPLALTKSRSYYNQITTGPNTYYYRVRSTALNADSEAVESEPSNTAWVATGPLPRGGIAGVVTDDTTGGPISGVTIQFLRMSSSSNVYFALPFAVSDSLGQFKAELDTGLYTIHAQPAPYMPPGPPPYIAEWYDNVPEQSQATTVAVVEGKTFEANFGLSRKQIPVRPRGTISGTITDDGTQLPLPHAIVRFFYQGPHIQIFPPPTVMADSLGEYRAALDTGTYFVRAEGPPARTWYPAYWPEWYDNAREIADAKPVPVTPGSEFVADFGLARITPPAPVTVEGTVTNDVGNTDQVSRPIAGATVVIMRPIQAMNALDLLTTAVDASVDDGKDVDGLGYCRGIIWKGTTDSAGHYKGVVLSGYSYIALAAKRGYLPEYYKEKTNPLQADLIKVGGNVEGIDFTLTRNPLLQNSISGKVRDSLGTGVPSRVVLFPVEPAWPVWPGVRFGHTDSSGAYALREVREGKYFVLALPFRGYAPAFYKEGAYGVRCWKKADTVGVSGDVTGIDIGIVPIVPRGAVMIAGRVVDGAGLSLDGVRVFALSSDGGMAGFTLTDSSGAFRLEGLASIPMTLVFDREGYDPGEREVTPGAGEFLIEMGDISLAASVTSTEVSPTVPSEYRMHQNYPNPFNPSTTITFDLPAASLVRMVVYNLLGQEIATLYDAGTVAGTHRVTWDGRDRAGRVVAAGLYLIRFTATGMEGGERFSQMGKMLLVK
jgi:hypothetical protein